ncbi:MAG: HugZ family protein [Paracoccaceae bacterium]
MTDPILPTDDEARRMARDLIDSARFGALAVLDPETGAPLVSRVAVATDSAGRPVSLISDLSLHTTALKADPACSLMVGEPGLKGDPLTHPRLTIQARAHFLRHGETGHEALARRYLDLQPKARLYIGFADFSFVIYQVDSAQLNGGFGKAYRMGPADLGLG